MKKIVYATDFSENSVAALKYAYGLGKLLKTDIIILHIFDPDDLSSARTSSEKKKIIAQYTRRLQKFCSLNLQENFENLDLSLAVVKGKNICREILNFVRNIDVLVLITGSCGSGTIKEFLPGSTAKHLISVSPFPVLTVPGNYIFNGLERVLYLTDFAKEDTEHLYELIRTFHPLELELTIVHIATNPEGEAKKLMASFTENLKGKTGSKNINFEIPDTTDFKKSFTDYLAESDADLIAMDRHSSKSNKKASVNRDVVKKILSCTRIPLLSM